MALIAERLGWVNNNQPAAKADPDYEYALWLLVADRNELNCLAARSWGQHPGGY